MSGILAIGGSIGPQTETIEIDEKSIKDLKIGHYVEITICGYVSKLSVPTPSSFDMNPSVTLKVESKQVRRIGSAQAEGFRFLAEDQDEDPPITEEYTK